MCACEFACMSLCDCHWILFTKRTHTQTISFSHRSSISNKNNTITYHFTNARFLFTHIKNNKIGVKWYFVESSMLQHNFSSSSSLFFFLLLHKNYHHFICMHKHNARITVILSEAKRKPTTIVYKPKSKQHIHIHLRILINTKPTLDSETLWLFSFNDIIKR